MDPSKISRSAIDFIRAAQLVLVALVGAVPAIGLSADDVSNSAEATITVVTAVAGLVAVVLEVVKRKNTTPLADPRTDSGTPLTPPGQ